MTLNISCNVRDRPYLSFPGGSRNLVMLHFCQPTVIIELDLVCLMPKALKETFNPLVHLRQINFSYFSTKA